MIETFFAMADVKKNIPEDKPLDALSEALRKKMIRLMVVSIGTMFIGIFAVLFAIVYKLNNSNNDAAMIEASVKLPVGFVIEETDMVDGVLMFRGGAVGQSQSILMFDAITGAARGKINID